MLHSGAFYKENAMIELKILIDELDYDSIAEYLIPAVAEKLRREEKGGILGNVLAGNPDMAASMARTVGPSCWVGICSTP